MSDDLGRLRVLLVDDNAHMRAIISTVLDGLGVRDPQECPSGLEALQLLRVWPADLAIVDYHMTPINGVEFTRHIRTDADSPNPYLPIIMLSGHSERTRVCEARDAGVSEFIVKPLTARALIDRVQAVLYRPRPFVSVAGYFGPDRRRRADTSSYGPRRRKTDHASAETTRVFL